MVDSPESEQEIQALVRAAQRLNPAERTSFLDHACSHNPSLRRKVESLLAAQEAPDQAVSKSASDSRSEDPAALVGQMIAQYKVLAFLGRGGMGEVYLAQDSRLGRKVALKLLPLSLSKDEDRLRRFEREARSASALNHPNVCVIYEVGEIDEGRPFIAMEFIEGRTLRRRFAEGPLSLNTAIDLGLQVASALAAAHQAGVVHRDIKPENVMLREDGYVKVLDFGLAKLTERYELDADSEAPTFHAFSTHSGVLVGTVSYLSPEQARRQEVDERTDIWSLGVMLYEMVTGYLPFSGETPSHIIVAILEHEPAPLPESVANLAPELDWMMRKALRKDREQRYQTTKELSADLREIKKKVHEASEAPPLRPKVQRVTAHSSALESLSQSLRQPRFSIGFFAVALAMAGLLAWGIFHWLKTPATPFQNMRLVKLTNTGNGVRNGAAISPDGKYVAYVVDDGGRQSLIVTYQPTASNVTIAPPVDGRYTGLTFSRDGNYVYYVRRDKDEPQSILYQVPALGGFSRKIASNVSGPIAFSRNGQQIAFVRFDELKGEYSLVMTAADGSSEKTLAQRTNTNVFSVSGLDWAPDGRMIAVADGGYSNGFHMRVTGIKVADGSQQTISSREWFSIQQVKWMNDGSGLILNAADESVSPVQIWYLSYPSGQARKITNDPSDYYGISLTADSASLVTIQSNRLKKVWVSPSASPDQGTEITSGVGHSYGLAWAPDGRIIYSTMASGKLDLWSLGPDASQKTQLTNNAGANYHPAVSPDGSTIFFSSNRSGAFNIWRMDVDGNNPKQLTSGGSDFYPNPSPDGRWVVFQRGGGQNGRPTLWKISVDGKELTQITEVNSSVPVVSPDGSLIACRYRDENSSTTRIAVIPFAGGSPVKVLDIPIVDWQRLRWSLDGASLTFIDTRAGVSNLWRQPLDGGTARQLTNFKSDQIFSYDWSRDGKQLACERGVEASDVVLISSIQ